MPEILRIREKIERKKINNQIKSTEWMNNKFANSFSVEIVLRMGCEKFAYIQRDNERSSIDRININLLTHFVRYCTRQQRAFIKNPYAAQVKI